ncbi:hypothetical protein BDQ12DRAFT_366689 [Crucibulum laeve]|uniref:Uncharacterized protein n=1 Tax=Crucibulum laeve TaxID=68775 RepID=A0A5C3LNG0_9AGAR|nr:hypothetical protein BDQ12DRAFT_366689 [Crucibulum laeve]
MIPFNVVNPKRVRDVRELEDNKLLIRNSSYYDPEPRQNWDAPLATALLASSRRSQGSIGWIARVVKEPPRRFEICTVIGCKRCGIGRDITVFCSGTPDTHCVPSDLRDRACFGGVRRCLVFRCQVLAQSLQQRDDRCWEVPHLSMHIAEALVRCSLEHVVVAEEKLRCGVALGSRVKEKITRGAGDGRNCGETDHERSSPPQVGWCITFEHNCIGIQLQQLATSFFARSSST